MPNYPAPSDLKTNLVIVRTADLSQAAGTYDLFTAQGDIAINKIAVFSTQNAATFTDVEIKTNQLTPVVLMTTTEGARANLTQGKNIDLAAANKFFVLRNGSKIQYTITGSTGTGSLMVVVDTRPLVEGAMLT